MATQDDVVKVLALLSGTYPNLRFPDPQLAAQVWHELLQDIPAPDLRRAVLAFISQAREFAPNPGQVRAEWVRLTAQDNQTPEASEAWGQLIRWRPSQRMVSLCETGQRLYGRQGWLDHRSNCTDCVDGWTQPEPLHPLVEQIARALGWPERFPGDPDDQVADRAHFIRAYDAARSGALRDAVVVPAAQPHALRSGHTEVRRLLK